MKKEVSTNIIEHYKSIHTLPIYYYNKAVALKDVRYIIKNVDIDNLPTLTVDQDMVLVDSLVNIVNQYNDEIGKRGTEAQIFRLKRTAKELETRYEAIKLRCFILNTFGWDKECADKLKSFGYTVNKDNCESEAEQVRKKAGKLLTDAKSKLKEAELLTPTQKNDVSFEDVVYAIETKRGIKMNTREISVSEWLSIENNFLKTVEYERNQRERHSK
mgnify:CR=1 FL=1